MSSAPVKTPKSLLHEFLQLNLCRQAPEVITNKIGGMVHDPIYETKLTIPSWKLGSRVIHSTVGVGQGRSKRDSQHQAALAVLNEYRNVPSLAWPDLRMPERGAKNPPPAFETQGPRLQYLAAAAEQPQAQIFIVPVTEASPILQALEATLQQPAMKA